MTAAAVMEYTIMPADADGQAVGGFVAQSVSGTDSGTLAKWTSEINHLPKKKQKNWKGRLYDQCKVAQRVLYVGDRRTCMGVPYNFVVYKQPSHHDGGQWWPVVDAAHTHGADIQRIPLSCNGARMLDSDDMWSTFSAIQQETHTGHHRRNHYVNVPTAPGEPVRG